MLSSIRIKGFRKYKDFTIDDFGRVNFILGNNNVGKTTVLEAIYGWACGQNISPFLNIPLSRGRYSGMQYSYWMMEEIMALVNDHSSLPFTLSFTGIYNEKEESFKHIIYPSELLTDYDSSYKRLLNNRIPKSNEIDHKDISPFLSTQSGIFQVPQPVVLAKWEIRHNKSVISENITAPISTVQTIKPFLIAKYIDVLSHTIVSQTVQIYSSLKREKLINNVAEEMRKVYPEIAGFDMIPYPDGSQSPISIVKNDGTLLPIYAYGDGVQRWFYILGAIALYKNSIICIDEIDTGFHPDAQTQFSKHLVQYARDNNVQLFITTHNIEYVDHFLDAVKELGKGYEEEARVFTLREKERITRKRMLKSNEAEIARNNYGVDLR